MLEKLNIKNVALIKSLEINFQSGFNVILGETGAGKSIIIDSLNFALGSKADKTLIRAGEETMAVSALFVDVSNNVKSILCGFGLDESDEVLLSRTYSQNGKGEARINGEIVAISMLKQIGEALVDSYGQNESIALLKQKNHLEILDLYKPKDEIQVKEEIQGLIQKLNELNLKIKKLGGDEASRERQIDLLSFQTNEIENANLQENEDEILEEKLKKLSNSEKIMEAISSAYELLENENGAISTLKQSLNNLRSVERYDDKIEILSQKLDEFIINIDELGEEIYSLSNDYDFNENELNQMIERRDVLDSLKRKYGGSLENVLKYLSKASEELEMLKNSKDILNSLENDKKKLLEIAVEKFNELGKIRRAHALEIEQKLSTALTELGILKAQFKVNFFPIVRSIEEVETFSLNCMEDVEFLFSANLGEELKPLAKTISGGEMNRFMLAFKNIIADINGPSTLIFDEIDSGISGKVATQVAEKIAKLSKTYQVLCISHLPQVASMGDCFFFVSKANDGERTQTSIKMLSNEEIAFQIALLTYGSVDDKKLELTREMLALNKEIKNKI
jgi:DNA repair protein RecN (Recombination protein N)